MYVFLPLNIPKIMARACLVYVMLVATVAVRSANSQSKNITSESSVLADIYDTFYSFIRLSQNFRRFPMNESYVPKNGSFMNTSETDLSFNQRLFRFLRDHDVSPGCQSDLLRFSYGLEQGEDWAQRMVDAFGKPVPDLMDLRFRWIGSYDECVNIRESGQGHNWARMPYPEESVKHLADGHMNEINYDISGQYCWVTVPFNKSLAPDSSKHLVSREGVPAEFHIGTCFPNSCSEEDIRQIVVAVSDQVRESSSRLQVKVECRNSKGFSPAGIVCLTLLTILGILLIVGTAYDVVFLRMKWASNCLVNDEVTNQMTEMLYLNGNQCNDAAALKTDTTNDGFQSSQTANGKSDGCAENVITVKPAYLEKEANKTKRTLHNVLLAFSMVKNGEEIFYVKKSTSRIDALEGLRFLTLCGVILQHMRYFNHEQTANSDLHMVEKLSTDWTYMFMLNQYPLDTFFTMSGFLLAYFSLKRLKQVGGPLKISWMKFYLGRFLRLSPTLYIVFFAYWKVVFGGYFTGSLWLNEGSAKSEVEFCDRRWWKLLLYINNFEFGKCYTEAWYLSADMQMFVISPPILVALFMFPKVGLVIAGVCIAVSVVYVTTVSWINEFLPSYSFIGINGESEKYTVLVPLNTISHLAPYVAGILTGYLLYKREKNIVFSKVANIAGWLISVAVFMCLIYLPYRGFDVQDLSDSEFIKELSAYSGWMAVFEGLARALYGCGISWVIFACSTGNGGFINSFLGWKPFIVLGRLVFCTYLVHGIAINIYIQTRRTLYFYTDIQHAYDSVGMITISYAAGFLLSVCLEKPSLALRKLIL